MTMAHIYACCIGQFHSMICSWGKTRKMFAASLFLCQGRDFSAETRSKIKQRCRRLKNPVESLILKDISPSSTQLSPHTHTNLYLSPPSPIVLLSVTESFPQFHLSCLWNREPCKPPERQGLQFPGVRAGVSSSFTFALLFLSFWGFWSRSLEKIGFLSR